MIHFACPHCAPSQLSTGMYVASPSAATFGVRKIAILRLLQFFLFAGMCRNRSGGRVEMLNQRGRPPLAAVA
jgi:hypothetical protein